MHTRRNRLVVLGLDGLPLGLARKLSASGRYPNLARLALSPGAKAIRAELPDLSPVNWGSFSTGVGPGGHGVFGFSKLDHATYAQSLIDSSDLTAPTLFERLAEAGLSARVVNLPGAYPAKPMSGMLVAGFVAPELTRAVHPGFLSSILAGEGYLLEADTARGASDAYYLIDQCRTTLASRSKALDLFWPDLDWDLFVFVLTETDRIFHFFYPEVENANHPLHEAFAELLEAWDRVIGRLLDRFDSLPGPKRLMALADHGFTTCLAEVDLNVWLRERGLLALAREACDENDSRAIRPDKTAAFALDAGRIYLNAKDRFPDGILDRADADRLAEDLCRELPAMQVEGRRPLTRAHRSRDIYQGPRLADAPDIVCEPSPGFSLTGKFDRQELAGLHGRYGCHTPGDAFFHDSLRGDLASGCETGRMAWPKTVADVGREMIAHLGLDRGEDAHAA
ncbi:alkaline phosphatase family protein [Fundidesulfovibrio butyratiphilus]